MQRDKLNDCAMSIKKRKNKGEKKKSMNILMGIAQGMVIILDI